MSGINRRDFLKSNVAAGLSLALAGSGVKLAQAAKPKTVRIGVVGVGGRGTSHVHHPWQACRGSKSLHCATLTAPHLANAQAIVEKAGQPKPEGYSKDEHAYQELMARGDSGRGDHRHPLGMAHADGGLRHGTRHLRWRGSAGRANGRGMLEACGHFRKKPRSPA